MRFYFYGKYIYTDGDENEVEKDMYAALPYFRDFYDQDGYEKCENHLENFFRYFSLTPTQKVPLRPNEVSWRSLLVVRRQSYRLSRLAYLTRTSYSVCSTPRGVTIQRSGR